MGKKEIEKQIAELITAYEQETDLEVSYVDIEKDKGVGFQNNKKINTAKIKIKN